MVDNIFSPEKLSAFAIDVLCKIGVSKESAEIVVDTLIRADLRGISTHGVGKLEDYVARIEAKVLDPKAAVKIQRESAVTALLDAKNGFGQVAAFTAMELAIKKASESGIGMVLVNHSNHFGIASYYSLMAAKKNLIGIVSTNASAGIAPFGAKEKMFGTNPLSVAVPSKSKFPIVLDMSSSVVARGKIKQALAAGQPLPLGWALDADGKPTTDPTAALKGTLEPVSGPKGSGLALMIEIICGVLSGSAMPGEVKPITDLSGNCNTGHFFCAIDPKVFIDPELFLSNIDETISRIKEKTPVANEVFVPGEIEHNNEQKNRKQGITMKEKAIKSLKVLSVQYGIPFLAGDK